MLTHICAHEAEKNKNCKRSRGSFLLYFKPFKSKTKCMQMYKKKYDEQQFISYKSCRNALNRATEKAKQNYNCNAIKSIQNDPRKIWKIIHDLAQCFSTCGTRTIFKGYTSHFHYFYKCKSLDYQLPCNLFIWFCF